MEQYGYEFLSRMMPSGIWYLRQKSAGIFGAFYANTREQAKHFGAVTEPIEFLPLNFLLGSKINLHRPSASTTKSYYGVSVRFHNATNVAGVLDRVNQFPAQPSWIIKHGPAVDVHWQFVHPVPTTDFHFDEYRALQSSLARRLGVYEVPRIQWALLPATAGDVIFQSDQTCTVDQLMESPVVGLLFELARRGHLPNSRPAKPNAVYSRDLIAWAKPRYPLLSSMSERSIICEIRALTGAVPYQNGRRGLCFGPLTQLRMTMVDIFGPQNWCPADEWKGFPNRTQNAVAVTPTHYDMDMVPIS